MNVTKNQRLIGTLKNKLNFLSSKQKQDGRNSNYPFSDFLSLEQFEYLEKVVNRGSWGKGTWVVNDKGLVDVNGSVDSDHMGLDKIPVKFGSVSEDFNFSDNDLISLEGAPLSVGGDFNVENNSLLSLISSPSLVGGNFYCSNNTLTSLEGSPTKIGRSFYCCNNILQTLNGSPIIINRSFYCCNNNLKSLEFAPKEVGKNFNCFGNSLKFTEDYVRSFSNVGGTIYTL